MQSTEPSSQRSRLARRLRTVLRGDVLFDAASRGRYASDASSHRVEPVGVVVPADEADVFAAIELAHEMRVPLLPRGAGTSQGGQGVGEALVIDHSRHLNAITAFDARAMTVEVQPGVVLDRLNAFLKPHGLWFPVDVPTSAQATLGGMAGNDARGARSIVYGSMVHNVEGIDAVLSDGTREYFGPFGLDAARPMGSARTARLASGLFALGARERDEIERVWPRLPCRAGGYNLDVFHPQPVRPYTADGSVNLSHLLVGSEGTLAWFRRLRLRLSPLPGARALGVVRCPTLHAAMQGVPPIVALRPSAVELIDGAMIAPLRTDPGLRAVIERALPGRDGRPPAAILLLVEFSGDAPDDVLRQLSRLVELAGELGLPGAVTGFTDEKAQQALWDLRTAALYSLMSPGSDGKPVSSSRPVPLIGECAVPLARVAEYAGRLNEVFARHGARGIWYGRASTGALHVQPILHVRGDGAAAMHAIAEEAAALVRHCDGVFAAKSGDGGARGAASGGDGAASDREFGPRLTQAFEEVKDLFDPSGLMNPGRIVRSPASADARRSRLAPERPVQPVRTALDWSAWNVDVDPRTGLPGAPGSGDDPAGGLARAAATCSNNGHCRKLEAGTMCPSWRVTRDEQHLTRGRANTLRLALAGRFGPDGPTSPALRDALDLCIGCKGCRRECPAGVDMSRMKIELRHHWNRRHGIGLLDRLVAYLPRYAPWAARLRWLVNLRDTLPGAARLSDRLLGLASQRSLPRWRGDAFTVTAADAPDEDRGGNGGNGGREVVLWADTFDNWFEPENLHAARAVLKAGGYRVRIARAAGARDTRPLCCGRTFLATGMVDEARMEARRTLDALAPFVERGVPVVGIEPSCLLTMRDEFLALGLGEPARQLAAQALLFEEFLAREHEAGRLALALRPLPQARALLHGHCHQKAFDALAPARTVLGLIPGLRVETLDAGCCGMAGAFGYEARHYGISMAIGESALLPAVRAAGPDDLIVADGTSCRQQIAHGSGRRAEHVAQVLARALAA
jgi:FAD/FMN-containing dehydrogenase/Fe-S oxidoreductase